MKNFKFFILSTLTFFLVSCQPDPANPLNQDYRNGVLVVNEGPFQTGTGTLSFAHFKRSTSDSTYAFLDVFQTVNGRVMGNIAQSAVRVGGYVLVAVNLAGTVEMLDAKTMELEHTFTGLGLPRYFQVLTNNRVALSDWQDNRVYVLDLTTKTVVDTAQVDAGPEGMAYLPNTPNGDVLLVACSGGYSDNNTVVVLNAQMDRVKTLTVGDQPHSFAQDPSGTWWLLNQGNPDWTTPANGTPGSLYRIDADALTASLHTTSADGSLHPAHLLCDGTGLVFVSDRYAGSAVRMPLSSTVWPTASFLAGASYGLAFDALKKEYYSGKIVDYSGPGRLVRYNEQGVALDSVSTGLIPGFILPESH